MMFAESVHLERFSVFFAPEELPKNLTFYGIELASFVSFRPLPFFFYASSSKRDVQILQDRSGKRFHGFLTGH